MKSSRYFNSLDSMEKKAIRELQHPWQRNFIIRFYELLEEYNLRKKDIPILLNNSPNKEKLLCNGYILPQSTLSESTNFYSSNMRVPSVDTLVAVALALGVSSDYLLGFDSLKSSNNEYTNIIPKLINEIFEYILSNPQEVSDENIKKKINLLKQYKKDASINLEHPFLLP